MVRVWGCIEAPKAQLSDFDTDKYKCIGMEMVSDEVMAVALMSEASDPPHYRVICGLQNLIFLNRKEALECLEQLKNDAKGTKGGNGYDY